MGSFHRCMGCCKSHLQGALTSHRGQVHQKCCDGDIVHLVCFYVTHSWQHVSSIGCHRQHFSLLHCVTNWTYDIYYIICLSYILYHILIYIWVFLFPCLVFPQCIATRFVLYEISPHLHISRWSMLRSTDKPYIASNNSAEKLFWSDWHGCILHIYIWAVLQ